MVPTMKNNLFLFFIIIGVWEEKFCEGFLSFARIYNVFRVVVNRIEDLNEGILLLLLLRRRKKIVKKSTKKLSNVLMQFSGIHFGG